MGEFERSLKSHTTLSFRFAAILSRWIPNRPIQIPKFRCHCLHFRKPKQSAFIASTSQNSPCVHPTPLASSWAQSVSSQ